MARLNPEPVEDIKHQMALRTARLESEYSRISGRTTELLDAEKIRAKHMERLLLQFENDTLRSELNQVNEQLARISKVEHDAYLQLHEARIETNHLRSIVQASSLEIENLRENLASSNSTASVSKELVTEKVRLSKDLSGLQLELERLKTQNTSWQELVAEKQDLERQLNMLEVQLENEKRARERVQARNAQKEQPTSSFSTQLESARKELTEAVKSRERQEHKAQQQGFQWATRQRTLENKIETLHKELLSTKDQLQDALRARPHLQGDTTGESIENAPLTRTIPFQRQTGQFNQDISIGTPGAVRPHEKVKRSAALPGDKSAFSITPYLSRTNGHPDSLLSSEDDMDEPDVVNAKTNTSPSKVGNSGQASGIDFHLEGQAMLTKNISPKMPKQKSASRQFTSAKRAREVPTKGQVESDDQLENSNDYNQDNSLAKPKKRKLGAQRDRSLLEEEDERHGYRQPRKPALSMGKGSVLNGYQQPASTGPTNRGFGGFQAFSPLKRDRKKL